MSYLDHFGLLRSPFDLKADPNFHFEGNEHIEAIERLIYVIEQGNMGFGLLTGEIGCGKTMSRKMIIEELNDMDYHIVSIENCNLPFQYLLMYINKQLGAPMPLANSENAELFMLLETFKELHQRITQQSKSLVIILDEAQQLSSECLTEFKNLTNIEGEDNNTITIILMGQPELREQIQALPPVDQRISLRFHLSPLSEAEVEGYMIHRLKMAGHQSGEVFVSEAIQEIAKATKGIPREVNRIAKLALDHAYSLDHPSIQVEDVQAIIRDLNRQRGI